MSTTDDASTTPDDREDDRRVIRTMKVNSPEGQAATTDGEQQIADAIQKLSDICGAYNAAVLVAVCTRANPPNYRTMGGVALTDSDKAKAILNLIDIYLKRDTYGRFRVIDTFLLRQDVEEAGGANE